VAEISSPRSPVYPHRVRLEDNPRWYPHAMKIDHDLGVRICSMYPGAEGRPLDYEWIASVFNPAALATKEKQ
jgi:hypothetical protein